MNLLFQGSLKGTLTLKDLLIEIFRAANTGLSMLELKDEGQLYFLDGHFIVGAKTNKTSKTSAEAFDKLLTLEKSDFAYYILEPSESIPEDDPLQVNLKELIENWPSEQPKQLSENELLDKIFNTGSVPVINQSTANETETEINPPSEQIEEQFQTAEIRPHTQEFVTGKIDLNWDFFEPLVSDNADNQSILSATQGLRTLSSEKERKRQMWQSLLMIMFLLSMLFVVFCSIWFTVNAPSSQVMPRRYTMPAPTKHNENGTTLTN